MPYRVRGESKVVAFDLLHANDWNPNVVPVRAMEALRESLQEHGMIDELLVREHPEIRGEYQVIDGEHRYRAIVEFAAEVGAMVPIRVIEADDAEAKKLTIIMNETRGSADKVDLSKLLSELEEDYGEDLGKALPWGNSELQELIALASHDWENYEDEEDEPSDEASGWVRFEVAMTLEDHAAYSEATTAIGERHAYTGDAPVRAGQAIAALAAEYLSSSY